MKILELHTPKVIATCPHCKSKLELEKGDVWTHHDIDGGTSPCVTCAACGKGFDVEHIKGIYNIC